jgi:FdhD protein
MNVLTAEPPSAVFQEAQRQIWPRGVYAELPPSRRVPEETPVAFAYEGTSYAVMMATPADLADFALGFSLNEGVVGLPEEIEALDIVTTGAGILLRIALVGRRANIFWERRRYLAGPSGCGLCGLESLTEAMRLPAS